MNNAFLNYIWCFYYPITAFKLMGLLIIYPFNLDMCYEHCYLFKLASEHFVKSYKKPLNLQ